MPAVPRAVLDTNAVLSALVFAGGRLAELRSAWQQARFEPLVSRATVAELVRVLAYPKFGLAPEQQRELLSDQTNGATSVILFTADAAGAERAIRAMNLFPHGQIFNEAKMS